MTIIELKKIVDYYCENERNHDLEVVIPNHKPSLGCIGATGVRHVQKGIDWDSHRLFIFPKVEMTEKETKI